MGDVKNCVCDGDCDCDLREGKAEIVSRRRGEEGTFIWSLVVGISSSSHVRRCRDTVMPFSLMFGQSGL